MNSQPGLLTGVDDDEVLDGVGFGVVTVSTLFDPSALIVVIVDVTLPSGFVLYDVVVVGLFADSAGVGFDEGGVGFDEGGVGLDGAGVGLDGAGVGLDGITVKVCFG